MSAPPKKKRAPAKSALQNAELHAVYHALAFLANIFAAPFWFFEQRRNLLADRIANKEKEGDDQ